MDIERVIAALAPVDVVGRAPVEITDLAYDARLAPVLTSDDEDCVSTLYLLHV